MFLKHVFHLLRQSSERRKKKELMKTTLQQWSHYVNFSADIFAQQVRERERERNARIPIGWESWYTGGFNGAFQWRESFIRKTTRKEAQINEKKLLYGFLRALIINNYWLWRSFHSAKLASTEMKIFVNVAPLKINFHLRMFHYNHRLMIILFFIMNIPKKNFAQSWSGQLLPFFGILNDHRRWYYEKSLWISLIAFAYSLRH